MRHDCDAGWPNSNRVRLKERRLFENVPGMP
jgi:hypothetical protein